MPSKRSPFLSPFFPLVTLLFQVVCDSVYVFYSHVQQHSRDFPEGKSVAGGCRCRWAGKDTQEAYVLIII